MAPTSTSGKLYSHFSAERIEGFQKISTEKFEDQKFHLFSNGKIKNFIAQKLILLRLGSVQGGQLCRK